MKEWSNVVMEKCGNGTDDSECCTMKDSSLKLKEMTKKIADTGWKSIASSRPSVYSYSYLSLQYLTVNGGPRLFSKAPQQGDRLSPLRKTMSIFWPWTVLP